MRNSYQKRIINLSRLALVLLALVCSLLAAPVLAEDPPVEEGGAGEGVAGVAAPKSDAEKAALLFSDPDDAFEYVRQGRQDPFMPMEQIVQKQGVEDEEVLTGMRRFEPGQLTLVGIVLRQNNTYMAMVQDSTSKGYAITTGTRIGRTGIVEEITSNRVLIRESSFSMAGDERYTYVDMVLKTKGGEE